MPHVCREMAAHLGADCKVIPEKQTPSPRCSFVRVEGEAKLPARSLTIVPVHHRGDFMEGSLVESLSILPSNIIVIPTCTTDKNFEIICLHLSEENVYLKPNSRIRTAQEASRVQPGDPVVNVTSDGIFA